LTTSCSNRAPFVRTDTFNDGQVEDSRAKCPSLGSACTTFSCGEPSPVPELNAKHSSEPVRMRSSERLTEVGAPTAGATPTHQVASSWQRRAGNAKLSWARVAKIVQIDPLRPARGTFPTEGGVQGEANPCASN
jgi:hypothetical protein